jgi:hypothetical protein
MIKLTLSVFDFLNIRSNIEVQSLPAGCQWLTPVILATQEAEVRRITVQSQPWQIVCETPISKKPS